MCLDTEASPLEVATTIQPITSITKEEQCTHVIHSYIQNYFPLTASSTQYSPFQLGTLLLRHNDTIIDGIKVTNMKIIKYLAKTNLIPVKQTTAYKVDLLVSLGCISKECSWTDLSKNGQKPLLSSQEMMWLIREIKSDTRGGESIGTSEIKERLTKYIIKTWTIKRKLHHLPSETTELNLSVYSTCSAM